ncbi:MAG TPA: ribosome small subunit-dependent GTPase A [Thermoanaerobaculia bacterium]|jgi:ribosome biogenesis GTPase|nr:ribosome small subunit-dependent GTPase A [Thermoanaerobaculia bacterium]
MVDLGWGVDLAESMAAHAARGLRAGRVAVQHRGAYTLWSLEEASEIEAVAKRALERTELGFPAIGDWVAYAPAAGSSDRARIEAVLPRRTKLSRKVPGAKAEEQVVAANVDTVFVMMGLDADFNLRRLERFLVVVWQSGAEPVIVLNKIDLSPDPEASLAEASKVAPGATVIAVGSKARIGLDRLAGWLRPGRTVALLGSSGVGKSTLVNALAGEELQATGEVRESDQRGQHTTSFRRLLRLPSGALLVDNPGVREVQLWTVAIGDEEAFSDVEALAAQCRFSDCRHENEPECAVRAAVEHGTLKEKRLSSWRTLQEELRRVASRRKEHDRLEESRKWRKRSEER